MADSQDALWGSCFGWFVRDHREGSRLVSGERSVKRVGPDRGGGQSIRTAAHRESCPSDPDEPSDGGLGSWTSINPAGASGAGTVQGAMAGRVLEASAVWRRWRGRGPVWAGPERAARGAARTAVSRAPDRRHVSHWRWQVRLAWARRREREACTAFCVKVPRLSIPSSDAPYVPVNGPGAGPSKGLPAMHPRACFDPHIRPRATFSCTSLFDPLQSDPVCAIRSWRDDTDGAV